MSFVGFPFRADGTVSDDGRWIFWQKPDETLQSPGFNCSGFVLSAVRHLTGINITLEAASFDRDNDSGPESPAGRDWDFGLDFLLNLASPDQLMPTPDGPKAVSGPNGRNFGWGADIHSTLFEEILSSLKPDNIYLLVISKPDRRFKIDVSYYHVALIHADAKGHQWIYQATARAGVHRLDLATKAGLSAIRRYFPPINGGGRRVLLARLDPDRPLESFLNQKDNQGFDEASSNQSGPPENDETDQRLTPFEPTEYLEQTLSGDFLGKLFNSLPLTLNPDSGSQSTSAPSDNHFGSPSKLASDKLDQNSSETTPVPQTPEDNEIDSSGEAEDGQKPAEIGSLPTGPQPPTAPIELLDNSSADLPETSAGQSSAGTTEAARQDVIKDSSPEAILSNSDQPSEPTLALSPEVQNQAQPNASETLEPTITDLTAINELPEDTNAFAKAAAAALKQDGQLKTSTESFKNEKSPSAGGGPQEISRFKAAARASSSDQAAQPRLGTNLLPGGSSRPEAPEAFDSGIILTNNSGDYGDSDNPWAAAGRLSPWFEAFEIDGDGLGGDVELEGFTDIWSNQPDSSAALGFPSYDGQTSVYSLDSPNTIAPPVTGLTEPNGVSKTNSNLRSPKPFSNRNRTPKPSAPAAGDKPGELLSAAGGPPAAIKPSVSASKPLKPATTASLANEPPADELSAFEGDELEGGVKVFSLKP
jgi:hypothetical protein